MSAPGNGIMCWWRAKGTLDWHFGYCTRVGSGLVRMGSYNGDTTGGRVVDEADIEWRQYDR